MKDRMFGRRVDTNERQEVLHLLGRMFHASTRVDKAIDDVKVLLAKDPLGVVSEEFETLRLAAIAAVEAVALETREPGFYPLLKDSRGANLALDLWAKREEVYKHQLNRLGLWGVAGAAFRSGRGAAAPSAKEITSTDKAFERVLDQIARISKKVQRHYRISARDILEVLAAD